jgi:hypothetical protein
MCAPTRDTQAGDRAAACAWYLPQGGGGGRGGGGLNPSVLTRDSQAGNRAAVRAWNLPQRSTRLLAVTLHRAWTGLGLGLGLGFG